jgi:small subunit ribosomal protein S20
MPILKHAKKKLKQDKKRTIKNKKIKETYKLLVKKAKAKSSKETVSSAFSAIDKAAKKNILSKNKAAHLKSSLTKHAAGGTTIAEAPAKPKAKAKAEPKKAVAKAAPKASKSTGAKKAKPSSKK